MVHDTHGFYSKIMKEIGNVSVLLLRLYLKNAHLIGIIIAQNAWTSLIFHSHRSGKFECERALNSPELEEKGPKLVK